MAQEETQTGEKLAIVWLLALTLLALVTGWGHIRARGDLERTRATVAELRAAVVDSPPPCEVTRHGDWWPPWRGAERYRICLVTNGRGSWIRTDSPPESAR